MDLSPMHNVFQKHALEKPHNDQSLRIMKDLSTVSQIAISRGRHPMVNLWLDYKSRKPNR